MTTANFSLSKPYEVTRPVLLDLFCGAGGASRGYQNAGFNVLGVDIEPQPNYCGDKFVQADAIRVVEGLIAGSPIRGFFLEDFHAIHASPPCQHFTKYANSVKDIKTRYEELLEPTRLLLEKTRLPSIIENVERSPLIDPVKLCGSMFDGRGTNDVQRHRLFEANWPLSAPGPCRHWLWAPNRYTGGRSIERGGAHVLCRKTIEIGKWGIPLETQKWGMGVDWDVTVRELSEAVPPAYTEFIGFQLRAWLATSLPQAA